MNAAREDVPETPATPAAPAAPVVEKNESKATEEESAPETKSAE
jgi:hypothetical protein